MKTIGIDIGTTTVSVVVFDTLRHLVLDQMTREHDSFIKSDNPGERIQDVSVITALTENILSEVLSKYHKDEIQGVGLSGQMHGILYVDGQGNAVSPLYTWQDQRGTLKDSEGKAVTEQIREQCGREECTGYGLVTHIALLNQGKVPAEAVSLCTIADYFGMRLTGRKTPLLHTSMAASLGFFSVEKKCFSEADLRKMNVDISVLPCVTDQIEETGRYENIPVFTAFGDNQASFLGSIGGSMKTDTLLVNIGTGGQISMLTGEYHEVPGIDTRPFINGTYLLVGASLCGGKAYAMLEHFFRAYAVAAGAEEKEQYTVMQTLAEQALRMMFEQQEEQAQRGDIYSGIPIVKTTFLGTRKNPAERGSISRLGEENFTPAMLILGVLQGMADELAEMYEIICGRTGKKASQIIASGNGVRLNPVLQQILKNRFGQEIRLSECQEEAACGAAISACGDIKTDL